MKLTINKIGKIKKADIDINGLTVIAGKNDTGKSTVGKVLYATFRALALGTELFDDYQKRKIIANDIRPLLKKYIASDFADENVKSTVSTLMENGPALLTQEFDKLNSLAVQDLASLLQLIVSNLKDTPEQNIFRDDINRIQKSLVEITEISFSKKMSYSFSRTFAVMFTSVILNSKYKEPGQVIISQNKKKILDLSIGDQADSFLDKELCKSIFGNVVYVETPFIFEIEMSRLKPHWQELRAMLYHRSSPNSWDSTSVNVELLDFIKREVLSHSLVSFDSQINDFVFQVDKDSEKLRMPNVACGVKSFILLFLLLQLDILTKDVLLVVDEPENHLHPKFQIQYAHLIALMVQHGFSVIVTSHSPTFIQALKTYSRKYDIQNKTSFYLAEQVEKENYSVFTDVSEDISQISKNLIEPMDQLFLGI